jgi:capsular exopolysaccharide synthesis family protein
MSRHYELMQQMKADQALHANPTGESALLMEGESRNRVLPHPSAFGSTQGLVQRVFLERAQNPPRMVVFAAVDHGSGCSQIAASVAQNLAANAHGAVCLVDANFRSPALPRMLATTNDHGLTNALLEQGSIHSFVKPVGDSSLKLLSSGPIGADSPNLLQSDRMRTRCAELRERFDFVIVDAPPMARYRDAIALGELCDGLVLVLEAGSTRRKAARVVMQTLRACKIGVLCVVLNKRTFPIPERIYRKL